VYIITPILDNDHTAELFLRKLNVEDPVKYVLVESETLSLYCEEKVDCKILHSFGLKIEPIDSDWKVIWRDHSISVGTKFIVLAPDQINPDPNRTAIHLPSGLAFGYGDHPTTQMMVDYLESVLRFGSFLDIGSGTGILLQIAEKLGFEEIVGCENDEIARNLSLQALNTDSKIKVIDRIEQIPCLTYDHVVVNIVLPELRPILDRILSLSFHNLMISGFLIDDIQEVKKLFTLNTSFAVKNTFEKNGWGAIHYGSVPEHSHNSRR